MSGSPFYLTRAAESVILGSMRSVSRKDVRYTDIGRVDCPELSVLPGVLDDISRQGCKVHFDIAVSVVMDNDYELRLRLSHNVFEPFVLIGHPQWVSESDGTTEIGFQFLHSRDTGRLEAYIEKLEADSRETAEESLIPGME
jgi:hypothetical protein